MSEIAKAAGVGPRWLVYSIGSQALAAGFAVSEGHIGEKAAKQLFLRSIAGLSGTGGAALGG